MTDEDLALLAEGRSALRPGDATAARSVFESVGSERTDEPRNE